MMTGIIWKVEALPTPVKKNGAMKKAKKPMKEPICKAQITPART